MPLAALFQYRRCRHQRLDTAFVGNRLSDAVVKKLTQNYVRAMKAKLGAKRSSAPGPLGAKRSRAKEAK